MKIMTDKQFEEAVQKAIADDRRQERIELDFKRLDNRVDQLMCRIEELQYRLVSAERKEECSM